MNTIDKAVSLFEREYSCSQSMLIGFGERFGLDQDLALKLTRALGAGMNHGLTCGAVSAALMLLGLKCGEVSGTDKQARHLCRPMVKEFVRRFELKRGTILCRELLPSNPGTEEGRAEAIRENYFGTICPGVVRDAAAILEELLEG